MLLANMSLEEMKANLHFIQNDVARLRRKTSEQEEVLQCALRVFQSKCTHPPKFMQTHRLYDERSRECTFCGYEW